MVTVKSRRRNSEPRSSSSAKQESLPGVEISLRHSGQTKFYVLARLSREKYRQHMKQKYTEVKKRATSGDKKLVDGHVINALEMYSDALKIAKTLTLPDGETSNAISGVDIRQKINDVLNDIKVRAISGAEQTADYGNKLTEPLVVEVHYQNKLLRNCPLKATYTHGTGKLREQSRRDGAFSFHLC